MRRTAPSILSLILLIVISGCAKVPSGAGVPNTTLVTFSMQMQQPVNPSFVYIIALNPSNVLSPTTQGPIPVVAPPWGNGFVAGTVQYFIRWDLTQPPAQQCAIYAFTDQNLINYSLVGVPINFIVSPDQTTLTCQIDLAQIASSVAASQAYQSLQLNFLTMNVVPQGSSNANKVEDALGNQNNPQTINSPITIPLNKSGTYDNNRYGGDLAQPNWVTDPSLDIVNFSVVVAPH